MPLGFTLIFATLFLSSVRSKLTAVVKDMKEKKTREVNKPHWQTLFSVNPLIIQRGVASCPPGRKCSKCLMLVVGCSDASSFYRLSWAGWALFVLRVRFTQPAAYSVIDKGSVGPRLWPCVFYAPNDSSIFNSGQMRIFSEKQSSHLVDEQQYISALMFRLMCDVFCTPLLKI